jgi:hypothetical protein
VDHVVLFSGGLGSWATAKRVAEKHGTDNLILLFCDTRIEDSDLYRFLPEAAANVGGKLVTLADGRTPWDVFRDERFLGNSRIDPCSRILKREIRDRWIKENFTPETVTQYVGIDWTESHRYEKIKRHFAPWPVEAPLCDPPYLTKPQIQEWAKSEGLRIPRLYELGFDHNNCGGGCVKAGQAHFAHLYNVLPCVYANWEDNERKLRELLGDISILRDRRNGESKPLTLRQFRERLEAGNEFDWEEWGGCSCFAGVTE